MANISKAIAKNKYTGQSAQKVRLVADMIRGKNAVKSLDVLEFVNKAATLHVKKCLASAIANAVVLGLDKDKLVISSITVDEAPTMKRGRIRSRRGPGEILKRSSHITIILNEG